MKLLKWIGIYIGTIIIPFCIVFSISGVFREGWIIYVNQKYDNIEKLDYKLKKNNIRYVRQETIEKVLKKNEIELPKDSIIQKITCTKSMRSDIYNIHIIYIHNDEEQIYTLPLDMSETSTYIINNGYEYRDNTIGKIKIALIIIFIYAVIETIIILFCKFNSIQK